VVVIHASAVGLFTRWGAVCKKPARPNRKGRYPFKRRPWNTTRMTQVSNMAYIYFIIDILFKPLFIQDARFNGFSGRLPGSQGRGMKFV
jgi:hypothetical protein